MGRKIKGKNQKHLSKIQREKHLTQSNLTFFKGFTPKDTRRIRTGNEVWDSYFFITDNKKSASLYGSVIKTIKLREDTRILVEGSKEFKKIERIINKKNRNKKPFFTLDKYTQITQQAQDEGYHVVKFSNQSDIGTIIMDRNVIISQEIIN